MSNKSEATWHPNGAPEVPHADLIARAIHDLRCGCETPETVPGHLAYWREEADAALAALGDTVPRETSANTDALRGLAELLTGLANRAMIRRAADELDRIRAERDALAIRMEVIRKELGEATPETLQAALLRVYETMHNIESPELVALHDAEVKAQALDEAAAKFDYFDYDDNNRAVSDWLKMSATMIREEAK